MTTQEYSTLKSYARIFAHTESRTRRAGCPVQNILYVGIPQGGDRTSHDVNGAADDADEILLLAYQESLRLGMKCIMALLVNFMRLSSKSINERSALPLDKVGKSRLDAFNKAKLFLSEPIGDDATIEELISSDSADPFDKYIAGEFVHSLNNREEKVLSELVAGYSVREICAELRISSKTFENVRASLRCTAGKYLL